MYVDKSKLIQNATTCGYTFHNKNITLRKNINKFNKIFYFMFFFLDIVTCMKLRHTSWSTRSRSLCQHKVEPVLFIKRYKNPAINPPARHGVQLTTCGKISRRNLRQETKLKR